MIIVVFESGFFGDSLGDPPDKVAERDHPESLHSDEDSRLNEAVLVIEHGLFQLAEVAVSHCFHNWQVLSFQVVLPQEFSRRVVSLVHFHWNQILQDLLLIL